VITNDLFQSAARALSQLSPALGDRHQPLLPSLEDSPAIACKIATAVGQESYRSGLAQVGSEENLERQIEENIWKIRYINLRTK
jgi:malic enzyme